MNISALLSTAVKRGASDIFIVVNRPPSMKINDQIEAINDDIITPAVSEAILRSVLPEHLKDSFFVQREANFAHYLEDLGRFRVNAFYQKDVISIVFRHIERRIPSIESLELPFLLNDLAMTQRGLILCVGATGTGKSTTQAAMIGYRNKHSAGHILTIEDPIEFMHEHAGCIVNQREVGVDTESFEIGLENSLRQAPDVILIGEIRTREVMQHAITFAETGHLCLATLHANNANQALDRIINFFPDERRNQLLMDLSLNLKAVIAQQLVPRIDGGERMAMCLELMINTPYMSELIRTGKIDKIKELMKRSPETGMVTFDQSLARLYLDGKIAYEDALRLADSSNEVRLLIKLANGEPVADTDKKDYELKISGDAD